MKNITEECDRIRSSFMEGVLVQMGRTLTDDALNKTLPNLPGVIMDPTNTVRNHITTKLNGWRP